MKCARISNEHNPKYFALHVSKPKSTISYFAEIESITQPLKSRDDIKVSEEDKKTFATGKRVVYMKSGSLIELQNPVPLNNKKLAPRSLRYSSLQKLANAKFVEDL